MRNDARPIGEALTHGRDVDGREADVAPPIDHGDSMVGRKSQPTEKKDDPADRETALPSNDSTLKTKI